MTELLGWRWLAPGGGGVNEIQPLTVNQTWPVLKTELNIIACGTILYPVFVHVKIRPDVFVTWELGF